MYLRTPAHLFGVALRILGREQAAESALQEAFVSVWNNAAQYRAEVAGQAVSPMGWRVAVVHNHALDALRSRPSALDLVDKAMRAHDVVPCLGAPDGSHRQRLALPDYQGLLPAEVAARRGAQEPG